LRLRKIEFEGIRAFADKTTFRFGAVDGLYFLQGGDNEQDPALGSNGVGKSTVWSILCWILFGKTADGLRAGDLKSWQSSKKGYYGKLWFGRSVVERSWQPNKLTLDGEVVEQAVLEDKIGINFDTFITTVLISQGEPMFFDLSAVRKLAIFTSLLQLDEWMEYSDKAKVLAGSMAADISHKEIGISRVEGQLDGLDIVTLKEKKENFKSERYNEMTTLQMQLQDMEENYKPMVNRLAKAKRFRKTLADKQQALNDNIDSVKNKLTTTKNDKMQPKTEWLVANSKATELEGRIIHLQKHKRQKCLACGQKISAAVAKKQIAGLRETIHTLQYDNGARSSTLRKLDKQIKGLDKELNILVYDYRKVVRRQRKIEGEYEVLQEDCANVKSALKVLREKVKLIYAKTNPYASMLADKLEQEKALLKRLDTRKRGKAKLEGKKDLAEYWIKGFKDVRLYLIHEALEQLEIETNKALGELGFSSEWQIKYAVERVSKAGRSMSGFNVLVKSPYSRKQVPFAAWSGGEKQRLKIAGSMGFMSLVSARTGLDLGLEVYDEPTQHLSPQGIDSLLEALRLRALEMGKRIWLVDHHTLDYGDFTSTAVVSKAADGRSSVWES